jgi:hypothetical protein
MAKGRKSESEDRGKRSEIGGRRSEVGGHKDGRGKTPVKWTDFTGQAAAQGRGKHQDGGQRSEVGMPKT